MDTPLVIGTAEGSQSGVFGLYQLTVGTDDAGQLAGSVTPAVRGVAARGDNYAIDATGFFTASPCSDCLRVVGLRQDVDGNVVANLELTHPFALPPQPEPLSARLDLHAFDVMGYIITDGGGGSPLTFSDGADIAPPVLLNADGYSDLYDAVLEQYLPSPNVSDHPYRVFFRDDTAGNFAVGNPNGFADLRDPQGHNVIAMGEVDAIDYVFDIPDGGQISVGLAIGASWGQGAKGAGTALGQRLNPVFFAYEFHHKAPWTVTAQIANNNLEEGNLTSNAEIWVRLRDWQIGAVVDPAFDVLTTPVDQIRAASEVQDLTIDIPGLIASPIVLDPSTPGTGTGLFDDAIWTTLITNVNNAPAGTYYAWVRARDERVPLTAAGLDRDLSPFTVSNFHTGALVEVEVLAVSNTPPTAVLSPNPATPCACVPLDFDASGSSDLETLSGDLLFEFDFDLPAGDPLNFTSDTPQTTTPTASNQYCTLGALFAAVRVTDEGGASDIAVVPVTVSASVVNPGPAVMIYDGGTLNPSPVLGWPTPPDSPVFIATTGSHVYVVARQERDYQPPTPGPEVLSIRKMLFYVSADNGQTWSNGPELDRAFQAINTMFWGDTALLASPDGAVYMNVQQARPDWGNTEWSLWASNNFGTTPWTQVYAQTGGQKYTSASALDPTNPANVLFTYSVGTGVFYIVRSTNGIAGPFTVAPMNAFAAGGFGGSLFFAPNNRVYHCSWRFGSTSVGGGAWVRRSDNGGASWSFINAYDYPAGSTPFAYGRGAADATDPTGGTFAYTMRLNGVPGVDLLWSNDAGVTLQRPQVSLDGGSASQDSTGAGYDPSGNMYVYWITNSGQMQARISADDGATFAPAQNITTGGTSFGYVVPKPNSCDFYAYYQEGFGGDLVCRTF